MRRLVQLDVAQPHLVCAGPGPVEHRSSHVDADDPAGGPCHLGGDEEVGAGAAAEVEHDRTRVDPLQQPVVGHAGEALDGRVGDAGQLGLGVAEFLRA
jgi:hypothetical protein